MLLDCDGSTNILRIYLYNFNLREGIFQALEAEHYVLCGGAEH